MQAPRARIDKNAIISATAGIVAWVLAALAYLGQETSLDQALETACGVLTPVGVIGAVICGHKARALARRTGKAVRGGGFATIGLVLGYAMVLGVLPFVAFFAYLACCGTIG